MKVLVDASFPVTVNQTPNLEGIEFERIEGEVSDSGLIEFAADEGYAAIVVLDQGMVSRDRLRALASERGVTIICSVTDDPFEAESNLRHALTRMPTRIREAAGAILWLRKDGLHPDDRD